MSVRLRRAVRWRQRGASAVEYALIATFIAVMVVGAVTLFGKNTTGLFTNACRSIESSTSTSC